MESIKPKQDHKFLKIVAVSLFLFVGAFSAGQAHAASGELWAWGFNSSGQLGLGYADYTTVHVSPVQSGTDINWTSIDAGFDSTLAIKTDGTLWAWGGNWNYNLGVGDKVDRPYPTQVLPGTIWISVAQGRSPETKAVAVRSNGTLWAWGFNAGGNLGLGYTSPWPGTVNAPTQVGTAANWRSVSAGYYNFMGIKTDGTLWAWGGNDAYGALGLGPYNQGQPASYYYSPHQVGTDTNWADVQGAYHGTMALKTNGTLWAWGEDNYGQLGLGYISDQIWPTPNLYIGTPTQVGSDTNWASISTRSSEHVMGIKTDGTLWSWGKNVYGELGLGTGGNSYGPSSPTRVGSDTNWASVSGGNFPYDYTMGIKSDGTLWAWGNGHYGQLGVGNTTDHYSPTRVGTGTNWRSVSAGSYYTVAITGPLVPCSATTNSYCSLPATASGGSAGTCSTGYTGTCNYTCSNGTWSKSSNSCTLISVPTVTSPTATSITTTSATLGANVTSNGGATLTARGTCWGTTTNPTTNCLAQGGLTTGIFTHSRTGLPFGTTIYYRGYAANSAGTGYSATASFTTTSASCTLPWGNVIASGVSVTAFQSPSVVSPATCVSETRTCTNGTLSRSYTNSNCVVLQPSATISANPTRVKSGGTSRITWTLSNTSCTAKRNGVPWTPGPGFSSSNSYLDTITGQTVYIITCTGVTPQSVTVNVLAGFQEF